MNDEIAAARSTVPIELPGASVPPLIVVLPTVPLPPSVPPAFTVVSDEGDRAVDRQRAAVDRRCAGVGVGRGQARRAGLDAHHSRAGAAAGDARGEV